MIVDGMSLGPRVLKPLCTYVVVRAFKFKNILELSASVFQQMLTFLLYVDSDKTIMLTLKHDDKLPEGTECSFKCAILYTTVYGQRRIRVMTLSLPCTSVLPNLFRSADLDAQFKCFLKQGFTDETPREYQCNLGPDGRRRGAGERPELGRETVEFVASQEYMPATIEYVVKDTGNCSPCYMRCTINQVVDFGGGPLRCARCKGCINPFVKFIDQGRRFICNLCGFTDETPRDYQCNLGPDGRRRDADERPELCRETVEFVASQEYMVREPLPAVFFLLVVVSMNAVKTGATAAACCAIKKVIGDLPPLMLIVPEIQDVYTPLETDIIVQLSECRQHLELLLESIPTMFQSIMTADSAFGAAVKESETNML